MTAGRLAMNRREFYENEKTSNNINDDVHDELETVSAISQVKRILGEYAIKRDSISSDETVDTSKIRSLSIDPETARCLLDKRRKQFLSAMSSESEENADFSDQGEECDADDDSDGESVIEEITKALASADCDFPENEEIAGPSAEPNGNAKKSQIELRLTPVIGIEETFEVSEEYATEFTVPLAIPTDETRPVERQESPALTDIDNFEKLESLPVDSQDFDPPLTIERTDSGTRPSAHSPRPVQGPPKILSEESFE
ncbi:unnamed protein product, partial [Nesidiocoris tenuis]